MDHSVIEITEQAMPIPGLPPEMAGRTIVQLSDLHRGCGGTDDLIREAVEIANSLQPDYLFLTGDFIDGKARDIDPVVEMVGSLRPVRGLFGILGNHDQRAEPQRLIASLGRAGVSMLQNRAVQFAQGLWLAGIDDLLEGEPDLAAALRPVPSDAPLILLSHNPNILEKLSPHRPITVLSGHTHGAQIALPFPSPFMICFWHLNTPFVHGWYQRGQARLYVNRGIGVTGPRRLARRYNCPPEITRFTLRPAE